MLKKSIKELNHWPQWVKLCLLGTPSMHTSVLYHVWILAGFFFAWLSWSNNNGTNLFRIWILYAGNYYKPVFKIKSWLFLAILRKLEKNFPTLPSFLSFIIAIFAKLMLLFGCFKRTKLIGKLSTWGEPLDQSASSS